MMRSASIDDPQSFNRYTYTLNNPVTLDDPDGMCPKGKKCYKDKKGFEYYDDEDGNPVAVTDTWSNSPVSLVFSVTVTAPPDFVIVYRSTKVLPLAPRTVPPPTRGLGDLGNCSERLGSSSLARLQLDAVHPQAWSRMEAVDA